MPFKKGNFKETLNLTVIVFLNKEGWEGYINVPSRSRTCALRSSIVCSTVEPSGRKGNLDHATLPDPRVSSHDVTISRCDSHNLNVASACFANGRSSPGSFVIRLVPLTKPKERPSVVELALTF